MKLNVHLLFFYFLTHQNPRVQCPKSYILCLLSSVLCPLPVLGQKTKDKRQRSLGHKDKRQRHIMPQPTHISLKKKRAAAPPRRRSPHAIQPQTTSHKPLPTTPSAHTASPCAHSRPTACGQRHLLPVQTQERSSGIPCQPTAAQAGGGKEDTYQS